MTRTLAAVVCAGVCLCAAACEGERATQAQCKAIFDRIVEIELEEQGFRDPLLASRHKAELGARYRAEVAACAGRRISADALQCVAKAKTTEELSHHCLR